MYFHLYAYIYYSRYVIQQIYRTILWSCSNITIYVHQLNKKAKDKALDLNGQILCTDYLLSSTFNQILCN